MNEDYGNLSKLENDLGSLRSEVEELKRAKSSPWYKNVPTIVSVLALIFSFGTTLVSYQRAAVQDTLGLRSDLRSLLQRLAALPKENLELATQYTNDAAASAFLSGYLNQENSLLARQAAEISRRLPPDQVSSIEYQAIAQALLMSYNVEASVTLFEKATKTADNLNDEVAALRGYANGLFLIGRPEDGRKEYQRALDIFSQYPGYNEYVQVTTHIWTELNWAGAEEGGGFGDRARLHVGNAERLLAKLPAGQGTDQIHGQVVQAKSSLGSTSPAGQIPPG